MLTALRQTHSLVRKCQLLLASTSLKSEDFGAGESDVLDLPHAIRGLRKNRGWFPRLCVSESFRGPVFSSAVSGPSDSSLMCLLFLGLLWPPVVWLNSSDSPLPQVEGRTF